MSKFRLISKSGDGIGLAHRIKQESNAIDFYLKDKDGLHLYEGVLPRIDEPAKGLTKDTIIIVDMVGWGKEADALRKQGYKVFGGSEIADKLELDRGSGLDIAGEAGIEVPHSEDFQDYEKAKKFLAEHDDDTGWVFKPEKNKEGVETFVSADKQQMIDMLDHYSDVWTDGVDFILQEVVEGVEVSSEAWFVNGVLIPNSYNNTWETKKFMNDNKSRNTGCMSSIVKFNACPILYDETFGKLEKWLLKVKYTGPLDINCIVADDGTPYMLEWTARMGYSAIYAFCEGLNMPFSEFVASIASGKVPDIEPSDEWLGALRLTIFPYPSEEPCPEKMGIPVRGLEDFEGIYPLDVMKDKRGELCCSGFDGIICEVTGFSDSLEDLWSNIYETVEQLQIPDVQYRTDILENAQKRISELEQIGYIEVKV